MRILIVFLITFSFNAVKAFNPADLVPGVGEVIKKVGEAINEEQQKKINEEKKAEQLKKQEENRIQREKELEAKRKLEKEQNRKDMEAKRAAELKQQELEKEKKEKERTGEVPNVGIQTGYELYLFLDLACEENGFLMPGDLKKFKKLSSKFIDWSIKESKIENVEKAKDVAYKAALERMTTNEDYSTSIRRMKMINDTFKGMEGCKKVMDGYYAMINAALPVEKPTKKRDF